MSSFSWPGRRVYWGRCKVFCRQLYDLKICIQILSKTYKKSQSVSLDNNGTLTMRFERRSDVRPTACRISEQTPSISSSWSECPCLVMDWSMYGHKGHKEPERPLRPTTHTNIRYRIYYTLHTVPVGISLELRSIGTDGVLPVLFCTACRGLGLYILFVHCTLYSIKEWSAAH